MTKTIFIVSSIFFTVNSFATINVNINGEIYRCSRNSEPEQGKYRCIPNCVTRYSNGTCSNYSSTDFCGYDASCVSNCLSRYNDGSCTSYGPDICKKKQ